MRMTKQLWVFPAVLCVLISMTWLEGFQWFGFILCMFWIIRIALLRNRQLFFLSIGLGVAFTGVLFTHIYTNHTKLNAEEGAFVVYPKVTSIKIDGDQLRFDGLVQTEEVEEQVVIQYSFASEAEKEGWLNNPPQEGLFIEGELIEPSKHSNFYQFNYQNYLKRNKIHWQLKASNIQKNGKNVLEKPNFLWIEKWRQNIFDSIDRVFNKKIASYLRILFFADNREFSEEALQQYRAIGVVHLFSISGFHITYLSRFIRRLLLSLGLTHERTNLALIFVLPIYGCLAGFGVSVFRAVFQNVFLFVSLVRNKPMDTFNTWSLTMIFALFINPYVVFHISFQLSYLLSGLFILMSKQKWIKELHPFISSILFSFLSFLASLPILTYHFFEISWVTILANFLFIPFFTTLFFPSLLILFVFSFISSSSFLFAFLSDIVTLMIETVEQLLTIINETFDFSIVTGRLPVIVLFILILSIYFILKRIEMKKTLSFFSVVGILFSLFYYQISPAGYVLMLDVGQGESIVIKDPIHHTVTLIDTGGQVQWGEKEPWQIREHPFSIGADQVVPALKALGISEIDRLYLTHADVDHFGEVKSIGAHLQIKEIAASLETIKHPDVLEQLKELTQTEIVVLDETRATHYPTEESVIIMPTQEYESKNNQSLVFYVKLGEEKWLFTGDIEKEAEQVLIHTYSNLQADHLKVAHHGSQTSSTAAFLEHVKPKQAWISAGRNNAFGHPNKEVLERLKEENISVYATNEDGAIMKKYIKWPFSNKWFTELKTVHTN